MFQVCSTNTYGVIKVPIAMIKVVVYIYIYTMYDICAYVYVFTVQSDVIQWLFDCVKKNSSNTFGVELKPRGFRVRLSQIIGYLNKLLNFRNNIFGYFCTAKISIYILRTYVYTKLTKIRKIILHKFTSTQ